MKLIADAGSTKTEWALIDSDGTVQQFESAGINALMLSADELQAAFSAALPAGLHPLRIHFYGAGCVSDEVCGKVARALPGNGLKEVAGDLLGAARALLGHNRGLAAILGTGSNCGLYDGRQITGNMPPLGYILGDEGSGTALGKALLRRVYRSGPELRGEFEAWAGMTYAQILERVYRQPAANAFLASLVPFIRLRGLTDIAREAFGAFFAAIGRYFPNHRSIAFTGGIANEFAPELRECARASGFEITDIQRRPMQNLIKYHHNHES